MSPRMITHQELDAGHRFATDSGVHLLTSPLPAGRARAALESAVDRDDVFIALLRALRTHADEAVLFAVKQDRFVGHLSLRAGKLDSDDIASLELPLDGVAVLADALQSSTPVVGRIASDDAEIERKLSAVFGATRYDALLLPIAVNDRVVAVAVGLRDDAGIDSSDVEELTPLAGVAGVALAKAMVAAKRTRGVPRLSTRPPTTPPPLDHDLDVEYLEHRKAGRWTECVDVLVTIAERHPARAVDSLMEAGDILENHLEDPDGAAAVYDAVRGLEPAHVGACERLTALYRALDRDEELVDVLLERADACSDVHDRIDLLLDAADVYRVRANDHDAAFLVLLTAFALHPASEPATEALYAAAEATGRWDEVAAAIAEAASRAEGHDCDAACALWLRAAELRSDRMSDAEGALVAARRAVEVDRAHPEALETLARMLRGAEAWRELAETLMVLADRQTDPDARAEMMLAAADVYETTIDAPFDAIASFRAALAADPTCILALVSLERLYRRCEMWEQYVDTLTRLCELRGDDDDEAVRTKLALANVYAGPLDDTDRAIELCNQVVDIDPGNNDALALLESLYEANGEAEQYLDVLERQLDSSSDEARAGVYARLASVWEKDYERPDRAAACLEKVVAHGEPERDQFRRLIELYRADQQWASVLETYRSYLEHVDEPTARVDIYFSMAEVAERELGDADTAMELLDELLVIDPQEPRALEAMARLREETGDWPGAIAALERLLSSAFEGEERAELCYRIGRIAFAEIGDEERGEAYLRDALSECASHAPTIDELARLYASQGSWRRAAETFVIGAEAARTPTAQARRHFDAASIYLDPIGDKALARVQLEAVLAADPDHVPATVALSELCFDAEEWAVLAPLLDRLIRKSRSGPGGARALADLHYRAGRCAEELGDNARANELYSEALTANGGHSLARAARADVRFARHDWKAAAEDYRALLTRSEASDLELSRIYYRLGVVHRHAGEPRKAIDMLERVVTPATLRRDARAEMADIQAGLREWDAVIATKRLLLADASGDERAALLRQIADIYREHSPDSHKATAAYREALEVAPDDHHVLQKLLDAYSEAGKWTHAIEIIERFIALEADAVRRGSYYQAAGTILRSKLKDGDAALDYFDKALDSFFEDRKSMSDARFARALEAFREMDEILTERKAWDRQERAYRRMIKRTRPEDEALLAALWHALGEIYRSRLRNYDGALQAFVVAHELDPSDSRRPIIIAELCELVGPDSRPQAIAEATALVRADPYRVEPYHTLYRLYREAGEPDKAWCLASALVLLEKADANEKAFFEHHRRAATSLAKRSLTNEAWALIAHPDENRYISAIFAAVGEAFAAQVTRPHEAFGLKRKDAVDIEKDTAPASRLMRHAVRVLAVARPDVFLQPDEPGGLLVANCAHRSSVAPAVVLRRDLAGKSERELLFIAGRTLTLLRGERYLKLALQTVADLETALITSLVVANPEAAIPLDRAEYVAATAPAIAARLSPAVIEQLREVVARLSSSKTKPDVATWCRGVDATAHRAGLLLCGELAVAARAIADESTLVGGPTTHEKIRRLLAFAVSDEYFAARRLLGVQIQRATRD